MENYKFGRIIISGELDVSDIAIEKIIAALKGEFPKIEGEDEVYVFYDKVTNGTIYYFDESNKKFHIVFEDIEDKKKVVSKLDLVFNDLIKNNIFKPSKIDLQQDFLIPVNEDNEEKVGDFFDSLVRIEKLKENNPFKDIGVKSLEFVIEEEENKILFDLSFTEHDEDLCVLMEMQEIIDEETIEDILNILKDKILNYSDKYVSLMRKSIFK